MLLIICDQDGHHTRLRTQLEAGGRRCITVYHPLDAIRILQDPTTPLAAMLGPADEGQFPVRALFGLVRAEHPQVRRLFYSAIVVPRGEPTLLLYGEGRLAQTALGQFASLPLGPN